MDFALHGGALDDHDVEHIGGDTSAVGSHQGANSTGTCTVGPSLKETQQRAAAMRGVEPYWGAVKS